MPPEGSFASVLVALARVAAGVVMIVPFAFCLLVILTFGPYLFDPSFMGFTVTTYHIAAAVFLLVGGILMIAFALDPLRRAWGAWRNMRHAR